MTSRPLLPDRQRWPLIAAVALLLLLAAVMAAGCVSETSDTPVVTLSTMPTLPLSDKELAEKSINDAEGEIKKVDAIIGWFRGNASTRDDTQLPILMTKREIAVSYLVTAEDEFANGNYERAGIKAQDAYSKANESYNDSLKRQGDIYSRYPRCERKLPFDTTICILLIGLVPVLLTALVYSLIQTSPAGGIGRLRRFMGTTTAFFLFTGVSVFFTALVIGAKVAHIGALRQWMYIALVPWVCAILVLTILSVVVIGCEVFPLVRSIVSSKPATADSEREDLRLPGEKIRRVVKIIVTILLILTIPQVLYVGLLLAYPVLCI